MNNLKSVAIAMLVAILMTSCFTLEHTVGTGATGAGTEKAVQWYALWGAVPLNNVDSKQMAGGAENYTIKSEHTFGDQVISFFTSIVTINRQTVTVKK